MTLHKLLLAICLVVAAPAATGCAAVAAALPVLTAVVTDAFAVLSVIDGAARHWFTLHPNKEVERHYLEVYTKTIKALNAANHALAGAKNLDQDQYDAAFAEFRDAYAELMELLERHGISEQQKLKLSDGSTVHLPEPLALTHRVE